MTVQQIETFKRENDLSADGVAEPGPAVDFDDEIDLRAEDDALIAAELEAEQAAAADEEPEEAPEDEAEEKPKSRRRGRRGRGSGTTGAGRAAKGGDDALSFEGTFDHGEEGYGLWLDPAVEDNAVYAEHWAGHRPVEVTIEADRIVIRRSGDDGDE